VHRHVDVIRALLRIRAETQNRLVALGRLIGTWGWHVPLLISFDDFFGVQGTLTWQKHALSRVALLDAIYQAVAPARVRRIFAWVDFLRLLFHDRVQEARAGAYLLPHDSIDLESALRWVILQVRLGASMTSEALVYELAHRKVLRIGRSLSRQFFQVNG